MDEEPALSKYKFVLEDIQRSKPYTLSSKEERLIAMTGEMSTSPSQIYDALSYSDLGLRRDKKSRTEMLLSSQPDVTLCLWRVQTEG